MTPEATGIFVLSIVLLLGLIALGVPIAFALMGTAVVGVTIAKNFGVGMSALGSSAFNSTASFALAVVPLFVLMGALAARAGLASDLFDVLERHLRKLPGGLAIAGIMACAGFSAITGSSVATVAAVGKTAIEEMRKHGYAVHYAAGSVAIAGTLGIMIPPSIVLVIYGVLTGTSIGQLLVAAIIPGAVSALLFAIVAVVLATRNPELIGKEARVKAVDAIMDSTAATLREATNAAARRSSSKIHTPIALREAADPNAPLSVRKYFSILKVAILFGIVMVGIYTGIFTATEAGAVGAFAALIMLLLSKPVEGKTRLRSYIDALVESARLTSVAFLIVVGGAALTFLMVMLGVPGAFADWAGGLPVPGWVIILVIVLVMVPLGMFLDELSVLLVFIPLVFPVVQAVGFDPIVFGILATKMLMVGMLTPPVGINAFVISAIVPGVKAEDVFRGVMPFLLADAAFITVIFLFPGLVLFLPEAMAG